MCFYDECDWQPDVWDDQPVDAGPVMVCDECGVRITHDAWRRTITAQEHECCTVCDDQDPACEHDYGRRSDYVRCRDCEQMLDAIEAVEVEEGCPPHARRPALTELYSALHEHEQGDVYRRRARMRFPALADHRFLREEDVA